VGADTPDKTEIETGVFERAALVIVDSRSQSLTRGEIHHAIASGQLEQRRITELGEALTRPDNVKRGPDDICVVDLTGVAVQDIRLAKAVCASLGI
jgi:ornithine cyclodeaminase